MVNEILLVYPVSNDRIPKSKENLLSVHKSKFPSSNFHARGGPKAFGLSEVRSVE